MKVELPIRGVRLAVACFFGRAVAGLGGPTPGAGDGIALDDTQNN